jgi:hypothetical protein
MIIYVLQINIIQIYYFHNVFTDNVIKNGRETGILNSAESSWTDYLKRHRFIINFQQNH